MTEFCFFVKDRQTIVLERADTLRAAQLTQQGYEKQFEEINATDEAQALARFADIRREKQIDQQHFLAGTGAMPLIGIFASVVVSLFRKK